MNPVAVVCSDIHLSHKPPLARSDESDWYETMAGYLVELETVAKDHDVPILFAGDLFDVWQPPPELIEFALRHLPEGMLCIPGQHDLPYHGYDAAHRSGYGVLRRAGKIIDLEPGKGKRVGNLFVQGFPWGTPVQKLTKSKTLSIALVHAYCWKTGCSFPGASDDSSAMSFAERLKGWDIAVFGDNHIPFESRIGDVLVYNCGGFMRRKTDEVNHRPSVGIVFDDGSIKRHYLDISQDVLTTATLIESDVSYNHLDFLSVLRQAETGRFDFQHLVRRAAKTASDDVRSIVDEVLKNGDSHKSMD